jgi:N utilization substance protein B
MVLLIQVIFMNRTKLRTSIMIILYQIYLYQKNNISYNVEEVINNEINEENDFVRDIVNGVIKNNETIDKLANKYLDNWRLDRLGLTDQAIIRIAIYEMLYTDTPNKVCINEAIELAKKYSDDSVIKMINGVLDKVLHNEAKDAE